jgi:peptidyl-dipeptidase A
MIHMKKTTIAVLLAVGAMSAAQAAPKGKPTVAEAEKFIATTEAKLKQLGIDGSRADWVAANFITDDTEAVSAWFAEKLLDASGEAALAARRFNGLKLKEDDARKLKLLQLTLMLSDPKERAAYAEKSAALQGAYGKAKYCPANGQPCMPLGELEKVLANSRDPARLKEVWMGWHSQAPSYKQTYTEFVALSNKGAREMGFADTGALWRSQYDMAPQAFSADMERMWTQVKPLYDALHTYTRHKLRAHYGPDVVPATGPIPAHLFGNMWSQSWENIYPLLKPASDGASFNLTGSLVQKKTDARQMTAYAEGFYTSLGMEKLPESFWTRSLLTKPRDREVVCHASAWHMDFDQDVRIKMCITPTEEEFKVIHHELGHIYYDLAYRKQPYLFQNGANDGFHEAIGDTVALSLTPVYLKQIGLMPQEQAAGPEIAHLLQTALAKVAFLPFAYSVDKWRWDVFAGKTQPADYDKSWWQLREQYMGVSRPAPMEAGGFDAGAKYHVASNTPYARYFLAHLLQFQFHRALCKEAGFTGPLDQCSIYGNKKAGAKLQKMLAMGTSKPWQVALKETTGEDKIDGSALLDYFAPLKTWLDEQNRMLAAAEQKK